MTYCASNHVFFSSEPFNIFMTTPGLTCTPRQSSWSSQCTTPMSTSFASLLSCWRPQPSVSSQCTITSVRAAWILFFLQVLCCVSSRSFPVPQWASECASLPVDRRPSRLCHGLWSHLLLFYHLLHVCPGMKLPQLELTIITSNVNWVPLTNSSCPVRESWWSSRDLLISRVSGTCWSWLLSSSAGARCLSSSRGPY